MEARGMSLGDGIAVGFGTPEQQIRWGNHGRYISGCGVALRLALSKSFPNSVLAYSLVALRFVRRKCDKEPLGLCRLGCHLALVPSHRSLSPQYDAVFSLFRRDKGHMQCRDLQSFPSDRLP